MCVRVCLYVYALKFFSMIKFLYIEFVRQHLYTYYIRCYKKYVCKEFQNRKIRENCCSFFVTLIEIFSNPGHHSAQTKFSINIYTQFRSSVEYTIYILWGEETNVEKWKIKKKYLCACVWYIHFLHTSFEWIIAY